MAKQTFTLTAVHLAMLLACTFKHEEAPYNGGAVVDKTHPFGDAKLVDVIAPVLGIVQLEDDAGKKHWPSGTRDKCTAAYSELTQALQVVCSAQSFRPGPYEKADDSARWKYAGV